MTLEIPKPPEWASAIRAYAMLALLFFIGLRWCKPLYADWKYERDKREVKRLYAVAEFMAMRGTPMPSLVSKARRLLDQMERDLEKEL